MKPTKSKTSKPNKTWFRKNKKTKLQKQVNTIGNEVRPVLTGAISTVSVSASTATSTLSTTSSSAEATLTTGLATLSTVSSSAEATLTTGLATLSTTSSSAEATLTTGLATLSTVSSGAEASLSTATNSLSTVSSGAEASLSTATNSLSTTTSSALDLNQLYSDQNQIFGGAAALEALPAIGGVDGAGVSVAGGLSGADNTGFVIFNPAGLASAAFGIEYTGETLYGYSPDPDFVQSTIINATLNGANGGTTAWSLLGGLGNDSIIGGNNNDTGLGGAGTDSIFGGAGIDSLLGEAGNDTIDGGLGNDSISGGADNDSLLGSAGDDTFDGGTGTDTFFFGKTGTADLTYLTATTSIVGGAGTDTIQFADGNVNVADADFTEVSGVEWVVGGTGDDTLTLGTQADGANTGISSVSGGAGNDSITLEAGFISTVNLFGGAGNDTFTIDSYSQIDPSGTSLDFIYGEAGINTLAFANAVGSSGSTAVINDLNVSNIQILELADTAANYVQVDGAFGIDTVVGGATNSNYINAQGLSAGNAITLIGGTASDTLLGGPGSDWLQGFADGSPAFSTSDTLTGGDLKDTFVLGDAAQNAYAGGGVQATVNGFAIDAVFSPVTSDLFRLFDNGAALAGNNPANFVAVGATWQIQNAGAAAVYTIAYTDGVGVGAGTVTDNIATTQIATFNYVGTGADLSANNFLLV